MGSDVSERIVKANQWRRAACAVGFLALLTAGMFADVLARGNALVLSKKEGDICAYFVWVRGWGFKELAGGNLALWNPHVLGGCPFFGNFQSALLYPPNCIFLFMDTVKGINLSIALHVFLAGVAMYLWARTRGISHLGATLAGTIFMFCGGYFVKIAAGHLNHLTALVWVPLFFLAIDKLFDTGRLRWSLVGGLALAMQVLAGAPQFAYYSGLAGGLYVLLNLTRPCPHRRRVVAGFALIGILAGALACWQVAMGMQLESQRSGGLDMDDAAVGVISPMRLLSLVAPLPFGEDLLTLNISAAGFILAMYGAARGSAGQKRFHFTMAAVMVVLAMGHYTPVFQVLYDHLPGYAMFRVVGRFSTLAALFLAILAGVGFDRLRESIAWPRRTALLTLLLGLGLVAMGLIALATLHRDGGGLAGWICMKRDIPRTERLLEKMVNELPVRARWLSWMLLGGGGMMLVLAGLQGTMRWKGAMVFGLAALVPLELFATAWFTRQTTPMPIDFSDRWWRAMLRSRAAEARTFHVRQTLANHAMRFRSYEMHGYEAVVPYRVEALRAWLQEQYKETRDLQTLRDFEGIWQMLRVQSLLTTRPMGHKPAPLPPMGRVELVTAYEVVDASDFERLIERMAQPDFDPHKVVYLESDPPIRPAAAAQGKAEVIKSRTDDMVIRAEVSAPAILLVTDTYSAHWRATPLSGSTQKSYEVMPANGVLRAIPLEAGTHHIHLRYRPRFYHVSMSISALAAAGCMAGFVAWGVVGYRGRRSARMGALGGAGAAPDDIEGLQGSPTK